MINARSWQALLVLAVVLALPAAAGAITLPQVDDFEVGTTQNWTNGHSTLDVANIADGGPSGTGDNYLQVSSGTFGTGPPRLITFNVDQWAGNYNMAGVSGIAMDLKYINVASTGDIHPMRIALYNPLADNGYASSDNVSGGAFALPNDGAWHHWVFTLS